MRKNLFSIPLRVVVAALLIPTASYAKAPQVSRPAGASLILMNGKVVTEDSKFSIAQAVAIKGDVIEAVGTNREILALKDADTRVIDLRGKTVVPGLMDN